MLRVFIAKQQLISSVVNGMRPRRYISLPYIYPTYHQLYNLIILLCLSSANLNIICRISRSLLRLIRAIERRTKGCERSPISRPHRRRRYYIPHTSKYFISIYFCAGPQTLFQNVRVLVVRYCVRPMFGMLEMNNYPKLWFNSGCLRTQRISPLISSEIFS